MTTNFTAQNNIEINAGMQTVLVYFSNGTKVIDIGIASTDGDCEPGYPPSIHGFTTSNPEHRWFEIHGKFG